ncbi:MAG: hypothetical protein IT340_08145 [Chloroflexi bacterium]|nr:hypothetical protein [Chloroflexota bacterium]
MDQAAVSAEMKRTTVLKTVILPLPPREIVGLGRRFFTEHGYRALPASSPNNLLIRGGREGVLPSVIGEIEVREKQGVRGRTSVVNLSGYGEGLSRQMLAFYAVLRAERQKARDAAPAVLPADDPAGPADEPDA